MNQTPTLTGHPTATVAYAGKTYAGTYRVLLSCGHIFDLDYKPEVDAPMNCPVPGCSSFGGGCK